MNENYFLTSKHIGFRNWSLDDINIAAELWKDPAAVKYLGGTLSNQQIKRRLLTERAILRLHRIQYWPIFTLDTNKLIGYCGLRPYKPVEPIYEMGILLKSSFWGKGIGIEAAQTVIDYSFNVLNAKGLFAIHNELNIYSKILLYKLGFQYSHEEYSVSKNKYDPGYFLFKKK